MAKSAKINRRKFMGTAATASLAFSVVPGKVLGGPGKVAPSDKLAIAYIGCGTQGLREMVPLLENPAIQIVAVADPNKMTTDYIDWSPFGIRDSIRKVLGATTGEIILLISNDFIRLVAIAAVIAFPLGWWVMNQWLENFPYRIEMQVWFFMVAGATLLSIALAIVFLQTIKASRANPVEALKEE